MTAPSDPVASDSLASVPEPRDPATGDSGAPSAPVNVGGIAIPGLRFRVTPQHVRDYGILVTDENGNQVKIDSTSNAMTLKATGDLKISAATISIEATGTLDLKANATLTVRGALVNIN